MPFYNINYKFNVFPVKYSPARDKSASPAGNSLFLSFCLRPVPPVGLHLLLERGQLGPFALVAALGLGPGFDPPECGFYRGKLAIEKKAAE